MARIKNVVCLELAFGQDIEPEHVYNMEIISKNLSDFNARFTTDIVLNYDVVGCVFTPLQEHDEKVIWFCEGINELLAFAHSPTCNEKEELEGLIYLDDVRKFIFSPFKIKFTTTNEVMQQPKEIVFYDETMETIMEKFENTNSKILPVLKNGKFIGFISKHYVLIKYREKLKDMIIE